MKTLFFAFLLMYAAGCFAQRFEAAEQGIIRTQQVLPESYTTVKINSEALQDPSLNRFDKENPYTYLQVIRDEKENTYQLLIQTDFYGKILFLGLSNNLAAIFNKSSRPMFLFSRCMKEINRHVVSVQEMNTAVNCIIDRLNYCSEE